MKHPQLKKARKVGEAVFRGARSVYTFEVFPLTTDIRDSGAVYIISRRITDRFKTGHHRAICVGEANSIVSEIKKHKRAKCARTYEANAVCILRENDGPARAHVIDDLVAARSFSCIRNVSKPIIKPTSVAVKKKPVKPPNPLVALAPAKKTRPENVKLQREFGDGLAVGKSKTASTSGKPKKISDSRESRRRPASKNNAGDAVGSQPASSRRGRNKTTPAKPGEGAQSALDSNNRRQHRRSNPAKPAKRRSKKGAAANLRTRQKLAA